MYLYCSTDGGVCGLNEEDLSASIATLQSMVQQVDCDLVLLREREAADGKIAEYLIRERAVEEDFHEVR